jgi:hypothetical protein
MLAFSRFLWHVYMKANFKSEAVSARQITIQFGEPSMQAKDRFAQLEMGISVPPGYIG